MIKIRSLASLGLVLGLSLASFTQAQDAVRWQPTLETATRLAGQTNRLVLIHFWAEWCKPCAAMDRDVFSRPDVAAAIDQGLVPVKLNVDHFPAKVRQYGVSIVPTDVIITSDGQLVDKLVGAADASAYIARLNQFAPSRAAGPQAAYGQVASTPPATAPYGQPAADAYQNPPSYQNPEPPRYNDNRYSDYTAQQTPSTPPYGAGPAAAAESYQTQTPRYASDSASPYASDAASTYANNAASPYAVDTASPYSTGAPSPYQGGASTAYQNNTPGYSENSPADPSQQSSPANAWTHAAAEPPASASLPPGSPPLAMDGFCPVKLSENESWVHGDVRWGARHQGRTYLFVGPEEQQRFLADPDQYAPVLSGNDVVLAVDQQQMIPGLRQHGFWYQGKIYLFANEASFQQFNTNPQPYVQLAAQMATSTARRGAPGSPAAASPPRQTPSYGGRY